MGVLPTLSRAAHAYLARTPSVLAMAQIDDLTDEVEPVNVPTTSDQHANWRRRLSMTLDALADRPRFVDIADIFQSEPARRKSRRSTVPDPSQIAVPRATYRLQFREGFGFAEAAALAPYLARLASAMSMPSPI